MSKFSEIKNKIKEDVKASGNRRTFSESAFNNMATAMINITSTDEDVNTGIKDASVELRTAIIGDVLKKAGHETDEIKHFVDEHQFTTLPMYGYVGNLIEEYLDAGKALRLPKQEDLEATLTMVNVEEEEKTYQIPSKPGESVSYLEKSHRRIKIDSSTPASCKIRKE